MNQKKHISFILAFTALIIIILGLFYNLNIIPHRAYSDADFGIEPYLSQVDQDGDGLDDQTDILVSARGYLATNPVYQSKYYAGGYPDDGYGVCTDVVAQALMGAGYDLMELVDQDIHDSPESYDVDIPDKNIDFRRVKNLQVYFHRHAQVLSIDPGQFTEWHGGDIVVFRDHIGIVSDHRNKNGVPFLIHHYSPLQATYEEDVLESYSAEDIIGHYRIS